MEANTLSRAQAKVAKLAKQLEAAKLKANAEILVRKKRLNSVQREADTRRKILLGAFALHALGKSGVDPSSLVIQGSSLATWLERDADRMLFNLTALGEETTVVEDGQSTSAAPDEIATLNTPTVTYVESVDTEVQALVEKLDGEANGMQSNREPTQAEALISERKGGSDHSDETFAELQAQAETVLAAHDSDLASLDQMDLEQMQDGIDEDHFE
jgi:hypothetical protein